METQDSIYRPTNFWTEASKPIINDLIQFGFQNFRNLASTRNFFVPTYGYPGNALSEYDMEKLTKMVDQIAEKDSKNHRYLSNLISGEMWALGDYRTYLATNNSDTHPNTSGFSESKVGNPSEHFCFEDKYFSRSSLNYLNGLSFLKQHVDTSNIQTVLEIGGGFGTLGEILAQSNISYINVDIPPTVAVSSYYLSNTIKSNLVNYLDTRNHNQIEVPKHGDQLVLCTWQLPLLNGAIDLFVNFISFQEMEPSVVKNYLKHVDRLHPKFILLRNMREGKAKKNSSVRYGVETPIVGSDYDIFLENYELLATNVFPFGYKTMDGFHSELRLYQRKQS
jgi:putative sugar O-methyltransferase